MSGKDVGYTFAKLITISGADGSPDSKSRTDFNVNLGPNMQKISRISIVSVTFPNNAYNINGSGGGANNQYNVTSGTDSKDFTVTEGFYTTTTLMSNVETAVNDWLTTLGDGQSITLTQDPTSQKVSITYTAGTGPASITIVDATVNSGIWEILGWIDSLPTTVTTSATAPYLPSLGGLKEVYLQSNELGPGNMYDKDGTQKNTLICIPITAPFGVSNVFECKVDSLCEITYLSPRSAQRCDFYFTDRGGNIVDLHGGNPIINLKVWFNRF